MSRDHSRSTPESGFRLAIVVGLNFIITAAEIIGGLISGSLSLISDALHNFSSAACAEAVQAEIANVAIYDRLMKTTRHANVLSVYQTLRDASLERHLPAFRRCAEREGR